jgi:hypothetical protein
MEYINAPINTIPKAMRVFGAHTPFEGSLPGLLGLGGFGWPAYRRRNCEMGRDRRAGRALRFDKHLREGLVVDILVRRELR